jgi:esterase/lipase superfamily enzyme
MRLARIALASTIVLLRCASSSVVAQPAQTESIPEPCRAGIIGDLAALQKRKAQLESEVRRQTVLKLDDGLRKVQEELLKVTFQIECLNIQEKNQAVPRAARAPAVDTAFEVTVYYATNRNRSGKVEPVSFYNSAVGGVAEYGRAVVTIPASHTPGEIEQPTLWRLQRLDPNKHFVFKSLQVLTRDEVRTEMAERLRNARSKSLLLFVHGYYTSFRDAAFRTAQIAHDLKFPGLPFFFSWPSAGQLLGYWHDGEAAQLSEPAFEQVLEELSQLPVTDIYILAHSMGSRLVAQALRTRVDGNKDTSRIRELLLAAPDINAELFRSVIAPKLIAMQSTRTTVYASSSDLALRAAKVVYGFPRLGETADGIFVFSGLETIDASRASLVSQAFGHSYVMDSPSLLRDVEAIINRKAAAKLRGLSEAGESPNKYWVLP